MSLNRRQFLATAAGLAGAAAGARLVGAMDAQEAPSAAPVAEPKKVWRPFSDKSPFNTKIPADAAVHANSAAMIGNLRSGTFENKGRIWVNIEEWSIPVYPVPGEGAQVETITCDRKANSGFESVTLPVWPGLRPDPKSDAHLVVLDRPNGRAWDFWGARWQEGRLRTRAANPVDLRGDGLAPEGGCRLVGFALLAGLILPEEIEAGRIDHALVFAHQYLDPSHVWPASRHGGRGRSTNAVPCGALVQLDPALDLDALDLEPVGKMIARALQQYGMYSSDFAGALVIYAENPQARAKDPWPGLGLKHESALNIPVDRMRVLEPGVTRQPEPEKPAAPAPEGAAAGQPA